MCVFCVGFTKSILMCSPRRSWTCLRSSLSVFSSVMWLFFLIIFLLCLPPLSFLCTLHFFFTLLYYIPSLVPLQTKTLLCTSEALALGKRWDVCLLFLWPNTLRFTGCVWRMVMLASWLSVFSLSFSFLLISSFAMDASSVPKIAMLCIAKEWFDHIISFFWKTGDFLKFIFSLSVYLLMKS